MVAEDDPDKRILVSCSRLRAWNWMSTISTRPEEVVVLLNSEARELGNLAFQYPNKAPAIIRLLDAYKHLAGRVEEAAPRPL